MKHVCKSCFLVHSHKHVLDHDRNLQMRREKISGNKLGSFGEKKNQTILFWNARPTEYDAESAWKKWTRFLTKFTANANGKFRLLFFLSNRPNREIHNYLLIIINVDTFTLLLLKLKGRRQSSILASCRSHTRGGFK